MTETEYKEMIYAKAESVKTKEQLNELIDVITDYKHDYGTIVYGCMAAMIGAYRVINEGPQGGITGFQAGCLGWECVRKFMMLSGPAKLVDYYNMLYPQYERDFTALTLSQDTWNYLREQAKQKLAEYRPPTSERVLLHWKSILDGKVPFGYAVKD